MVASTRDVFLAWDATLRNLHEIRKCLMSGLDHVEERQSVWERRYWRGADDRRSDKLESPEVERLCRRLNIYFSPDDLKRRFEVYLNN